MYNENSNKFGKKQILALKGEIITHHVQLKNKTVKNS